MQQAIRSKIVSAGPEAKDLSLSDLWVVIRKRRVLLLCIAVGLAVLAATAGIIRGKRYTATGQIQVQPGSAADLKSSISSMLTSGVSSLDDIMESDTQVLQSPTLIINVAKKLKLQNNEDFLGSTTYIRTSPIFGDKVQVLNGDINNPWVQIAIEKIFLKHLDVERVPRTNLISIEYEGRTPEVSANIVNTLEAEYILENYSSHYKSTKQVTDFLEKQIDDLRALVQNSQDKMIALQQKLGIYALDPSHSLPIAEIANLEKGVADATEQRVLAEARYRILKSLPPDQVQASQTPLGEDGTQSLLATLRGERAQAAASLAHLQPVYGPNYPQVKQINAQIASLDDEISGETTRVVNQAKDAFGVAQNAEDKAKGMLDDKEQSLYGQRDDILQYMLVSEEYESNRTMYESILSRLQEAAVDAGLDSADLSIVDLAPLPVQPSSLHPALLALIGLVFGAFAGMTLALFLEKMDTRLRDAHEIQEMLGLPSLAIIPQSHWKGKESDVEWVAGPELLRDPRSPFSESFRALRTSMRLSSTSRQSKVIAVTSCQPAEGKSTVSVNMAAAFAQGGKK
ncbi:MAG: Wzz/FepE/Etk N-terminal domain-containing protein, partial [Acidobacteriaceae bacterium]